MKKRTGIGLLFCLAACGTPDYVKTNATLGKVVVYRNGVAYFERRAQLEGKELSLSVPKDKVDDFLKSLTVRDAATGKSLPVSFPRKGTERSGMVDMVVSLGEEAGSEVILTYITDSPAWKPSYRLVVDEEGKVQVEGWAIVDNTSGENWKDVLVGVGSSSALSFRYDLWSIRDVHRQILDSEERFAVAPPQGASTYGAGDESTAQVITEFSDSQINMPTTHPDGVALSGSASLEDEYADEDVAEESIVATIDAAPISGRVAGRSFESRMGAAKPRGPSREEIERRKKEAEKRKREAMMEQQKRDRNQRQVQALAAELKKSKGRFVIEGYAAIDDADKDARALDRANVLRNQLIQEGVAPAQISVRSAGAKEGRPAGVRLVAEGPKGEDNPAEKEAEPVGESHFQSKTPMSVHENASVMVSIVKDDTEGKIVYLYDAESSRGNKRYAFKAVRFENPTSNTLEAGPVTVYGDSRFVGEGLTDPIPPNAMAMVPYALDRQIVVDKEKGNRDKIARLVKLERGVLTTEVQHIRETRFQIKNRLRTPATVYVRHSVLDGWTLQNAPENAEMLGTAHIFPVELKAGESRELLIEEATPMTKTLDLRSPAAMEIVKLYLSGDAVEKGFAGDMEALLALHREIADHQQAITSLRARLRDYRKRMDELHIQIVSLKAVKSGGTLMKHLKKKMEVISERVQRATFELVEHQEELMLARIKFQDAVAELSLKETSS